VSIDDDVAENDAREMREAIERLSARFPERNGSFSLNEVAEERG